MITLYGFRRVPGVVVGFTRDLRALWALEETGLPYRVKGLDFEFELQTEEYRQVSPFAQVPAIDDDGFVLCESGAVLLYLAEKAGTFAPRDPRGHFGGIAAEFATRLAGQK